MVYTNFLQLVYNISAPIKIDLVIKVMAMDVYMQKGESLQKKKQEEDCVSAHLNQMYHKYIGSCIGIK